MVLDEDIIGTVTDVVQHEDDHDDDPVEVGIAEITHTKGIKALELELCYIEQQSIASSVELMMLKRQREYATKCWASCLQQKVTDFFMID